MNKTHRAHWLQHVPFEGLGSIESWLTTAGYSITCTRLFASPTLPQPDDLDLLVIMGGPMSVNDQAALPWLREEKDFIRRCIQGGKPVLGICLGAQLIASALGAAVYRNRVKEIGWFPIFSVPGGESVFRFPPTAEVFHWHGETFDLPPGAVHLARSSACENQAFQLGHSVIALQCHLETTPELLPDIADDCPADLIPSPTVQSKEAMLAAPPEKYRTINGLMSKVLGYLTR
jgi:GMP synthase-like glutamine amidotransferase